jgi:hypothetical protein
MVEKENTALQKVKSFIDEQQGRLLEKIGDSKELDNLSGKLESFLKKMNTSIESYRSSLYEEYHDFQKILDKLEEENTSSQVEETDAGKQNDTNSCN